MKMLAQMFSPGGSRGLKGPGGFTRTCVFTVSLAFPLAAWGDDWPQWRGPQHDGVWRENGILQSFPENGPKVLWRAEMGSGYSGPAVAGGRVFVMDRKPAVDAEGRPLPAVNGALQGSERVLCMNASDGSAVWTHSYDSPYVLLYPQGPRTTPVVRDGKVYALGAMGRLDCLDAQTGEVIWYKQLAALFDAPVPTWGWSAHPVVWENMVFVLAGGKGSAVAAFDKDSGEELWSALTVEEIGYAPPLLIEAGGKRQLVVWLDTSVSGLDPQTGAVLWSEKSPEPGPPQRPVVNIAAPIAGQGRLFVSEFYQGALMLELASDRPGPAVMWRSTESNPMQPEHLNCIMSTPLLKDGHLYGMCGFGELRCLKADTGEVVWESLEAIGGRKAQSATAFLVPHEDRCFLFSDQGDLIIARLSPEGYEELDRAHLLDPTTFARGRTVVWSHPAFAGRCVFARNDKEMICVSLASEG